MNHVLLLGAGFSRNWGGWTADELIDDLLGRVASYPNVLRRLQATRDFERVFSELLGEKRGQGTSETNAAFDLYQTAIRDAFQAMNEVFAELESFEFCDHERSRVCRFLAGFDAIFTLNQDLLLELQYRPDQFNAHTWAGVYFPQMRPPDRWETRERFDLLRQTWTTDASYAAPGGRFQPIYKMHGSVNWRTGDDSDILVIGTNKHADIQNNPTLRYYAEEFIRCISAASTRLMVIGYGFGDKHVNDAILAAANAGTLTMFMIDAKGYKVFNKYPHAQIRLPVPLAEVPCIGISTRPLSSTFGADILELKKLYRFFVAPKPIA